LGAGLILTNSSAFIKNDIKKIEYEKEKDIEKYFEYDIVTYYFCNN
jgi:hypothetical protein